MIRVIGRTGRKVLIGILLDEELFARFSSQYETEAFALRACQLMFEDMVRIALVDGCGACVGGGDGLE